MDYGLCFQTIAEEVLIVAINHGVVTPIIPEVLIVAINHLVTIILATTNPRAKHTKG